MNRLAELIADDDKRLIGVLLLVLMREKSDKSLILALIYILFA